MIVTERTRLNLSISRKRKLLRQKGWIEVGPWIGVMWDLHCGGKYDHRIASVAIDPGKKTVWIRIEKNEILTREHSVQNEPGRQAEDRSDVKD